MRAFALLAIAACAACLAACDGDECRDADGDGFGAHCQRGPDCNDGDPAVGESCDASVPDCDVTPEAAGCPCLAGSQLDCYLAPAETMDVGICRGGHASCANGQYDGCEDSVVPRSERCNGLDDDCDGTTDEGVRSPCGGCNDACVGGVWGPPLVPFEARGDLAVTAAGELTLRRELRDVSTVWVPNTDEGTVSKIDVARSLEVARYRTAGGAPIRVAVDHRGDAFFLDETASGEATKLTKIAADRSRCLAAGGGKPQTSSGPDDVRDLGSDDCVRFGVSVGGKGEAARALAIDGALGPDDVPSGNLWIGLEQGHALLELDGETGKQRSRLSLPKDFAPYAGAFDVWGTLWLIDRDGKLGRVDTRAGASPAAVSVMEVPLACYQLESLALDPDGRVLITSPSCETAIEYDPKRKRFTSALAPDLLTPRGVAMRASEAWVSLGSGQLGRVTPSPLAFATTFPLARGRLVPYDALAISTDDTGRLWVASALGGEDGRGLLSAFDPVAEEVVSQLSVGFGPRAQGDMTGAALGGEAAAAAETSRVFAGCGHESTPHDAQDAGTLGRPTVWKRVHVSAVVSPDAELVVSVRHASEVDALPAARYVTLGTLPTDSAPFALSLPAGGAVEVRLSLRSHGALAAPRVSSVGVEWTCPGPD